MPAVVYYVLMIGEAIFFYPVIFVIAAMWGWWLIIRGKAKLDKQFWLELASIGFVTVWYYVIFWLLGRLF